MIFHVFSKERGIGKCELVANLLDAEICLAQVVTNVLQHMFCNPFVSGLARILLADNRKVFGRDTKFAGISFYRATFHIVGVQQIKEVLEVDFRCHFLVVMQSDRVSQTCI